METHPIRLRPGQDLKQALDDLVRTEKWSALCILSGIGSLGVAAIRYAGREETEVLEGPLEIISLAGTLSKDGSHIHILVSDGTGACFAGHLKEGAIVNTTAEIILGILPDWQFHKEIDPETGYPELVIKRLK